MTIELDNLFAVIVVTAAEPDAGIADSKRLLVTVMARSENTGMKYDKTGQKMIDRGRAPILLEPVNATITVNRPGEAFVNILNHDGRRTRRTFPMTERRSRGRRFSGNSTCPRVFNAAIRTPSPLRPKLPGERWRVLALHEKPVELYNLESDATEQRNVTEDHPYPVASLTAQLHEWLSASQ